MLFVCGYRYENIRREQAARLQDNHQRSMQILKSQERPFSFYGKALAKEEATKQYKAPTAKDFQRHFKANPIPKSSLEVNTPACMLVRLSVGGLIVSKTKQPQLAE